MSYLSAPVASLPSGPSPDSGTFYIDPQAIFDTIPVVFSRWLFTCLVFIFVIPTSRDAEICGILTALFIWMYDSGLTNIMGKFEELKDTFELVYAISPFAALLMPLGFVGFGTVFAAMKGLWFGRFLICGLVVSGAALSWSVDTRK